jgi:pimeloyl-ACP methyl ester carboxylesterase
MMAMLGGAAAVLAAMALMAGCGGSSAPQSMTIDQKADQSKVTVAVEGEVVISLEENPTTGYEWLMTFGDGLKVLPQMTSEDLATNVAATRQFLRNCFEKQPSQDDFENMLAFNMMVPPKVCANMGGRTLNIDDILVALKLPVLITQGAMDRLVLPAAAKYSVEKIPGAKLSMYDGIGHAPFWEDARRYNAELSGFVQTASKTN